MSQNTEGNKSNTNKKKDDLSLALRKNLKRRKATKKTKQS